jgi:hypothetical protein
MADNKANIDILINTANSAKSIRELRGALKDLVSAQQDVDKSSPDFQNLVAGINETESRIGDLNDSFKSFSGTGMERLTSSTYLLKDGFQNLDLDKVKIAFGGLSQLPKALAGEFTKLTGIINKLDFKSLGTSMKTLGESGVGALTKSIVQLGKAILTNPILLLAAVIIGLVAVVVKFYDKIIPLRVAIEAFGAVLDVVVQSLKDFADWIGITDFAGDEAATNQIARNERLSKDNEAMYEHNVAMAQAAGKDTYKIEMNNEKLKRDLMDKEVMSLSDQLKRKMIKQEEFEKAVWEIHDKYVASKNKEEELTAKNDKKISDEKTKSLADDAAKYKDYLKQKTEAEKLAMNQVQDLELKNKLFASLVGKEGEALYKQQIENRRIIADNAAQKEKEALIKIANDTFAKTRKGDADYLKDKETNTKALELIDTNYKNVKLSNERAAADEIAQLEYKKFQSIKEFEGLKAKLAGEGEFITSDMLAKRLENLKVSLDKDLAFFKGTEEEKKVLRAKYALEASDLLKAYRLQDQNDLVAKNELAILNEKEGSLKQLEAKKAALALQTVIELENENLTKNEKLLIEKRYRQALKDLDKEYLDGVSKSSVAEQAEWQKKISNIMAKYAGLVNSISSGLNAIGDYQKQKNEQEIKEYNDKQNTLMAGNKYALEVWTSEQDAQMNKDLSNENLTSEQKSAIQLDYADRKVKAQNEAAMAEYKIKLEMYKVDKDLKHKEFVRNKRMAIASAIISGAMAVMNMLTMPPPPVGIAMAAAAAITTGINIAKIKSQTEDSGGGEPAPPIPVALPSSIATSSGSGGGSGGGGMGGGGSTLLAPQFYKLGQGGAGGDGGGMGQRVYVLESDITRVQRGVSLVETRATTKLG